MRTWVYIDGFNLYYAIRESGCKWLNLKALAEAAMPAGTVTIDNRAIASKCECHCRGPQK